MIEPTFYQTDLTNQGHLKNLWYKCLDGQPEDIREQYSKEECERCMCLFIFTVSIANVYYSEIMYLRF